ncbi:MAG: RidA family protein [Deltaproteobacteria bacterium]|nr:MAG: RidA family protein [Deltaproteobacteria bacterium]TMQ22278.1 MAG: RidA family protein [Deltaproteobacteria bacterium]
MTRQLVSSGSPYEAITGFSRAVRIGPWISVAGTAPLRGGVTAHPGDVYGQTRECLTTIIAAVTEAGGSIDAIVRTRVMLTNIDAWRDAARAHGEFFGKIRPACTFVGVSRFIDPEWLVEIEADAYVL